MANHVTSSKLVSRSARLKLEAREDGKAHFLKIARGIHLGYRRNATNGAWTVRCTIGGQDWQKGVGLADDFAEANGDTILTFYEAQDRANKIARAGKGGEAVVDLGAPATVESAIEAYKANLRARGKSVRNAATAKAHLPPAILNKVVALLTTAELRRYRDRLIEAGLEPASVNRITCPLKAALTLAAQMDRSRITNQWAWKDGLELLEGARESRNVVITDEEVRRVVEAAYEINPEFGLLIEVAAVTGARYSQLARIKVRDLQARRVMIPTSPKGRGVKNKTHTAVPLTPSLAIKLQQIAAGRTLEALLLVKPNGTAWKPKDQWQRFRVTAERAGLDPDRVTMYALRHSSITRQLLAGVARDLVADRHDTSVAMIEATYGAYISEHGEDPRGLIETGPALKVVA